MNSLNAALLVNVLGFTVGIALYALLAAMVARHRSASVPAGTNVLLLMTAFLGLLWNLGELFVIVGRDFGSVGNWPFLTAASYSALGFLPSVVVHSARADHWRTHWLTYAAYSLSCFASVLHFLAAFQGWATPSDVALKTLTFGSIAMAASLVFLNFKQTLDKKSILATALLIFALSALHLSGGGGAENSWVVELVAHQSSLPLALAILYQNYRFAFADLFLKRSISLLLLALVAFGLYVTVAAPLLRYHETHDRNDVQAVSLIITLWIATALIYPSIHRLAVWIVDKLILHRVDYSGLQAELARGIEKCNSVDEVLDAIGTRLGEVLTADKVVQKAVSGGNHSTGLVRLGKEDVDIFIPVTESPFYHFVFGDFRGGRRLLSEETAMLEGVALVASRRIDAMRVSQERFEREFREQEFSKLAAEAQLTALRAQINPHFLFNALTTIGYLIETAPEKALETLLHLTKLLRGVLSRTGEFCTLAEELKLIVSYLDIERARFEERLAVTVDVPSSLYGLSIPSLILQPLVENSIKHGISENKDGGEVRISAELVGEGSAEFLKLVVSDSGAGLVAASVQTSSGVGLRNVRGRLASHYGPKAILSVESDPAKGTRASVLIPVQKETALN